MKAVLIYSKHDARQWFIPEFVEKYPWMLKAVEFDECPDLLKYLVKETPAFISADEHLQGEILLTTENDALLLEATLMKRIDEEEMQIHNVNYARLDSMVMQKEREAVDVVMDGLTERGII